MKPQPRTHRGLHGIWPALMTPLAEDGTVDHGRFAAHARRLLEAGCAGLTAFGTTGEGPSFSFAERRDAVEALVAQGLPAERLLVSTSCAALPEAIALTRHAQALGAWGVLLMPPFFFKGPSDQGIVDAYARVIEATADRPLRVVLYHIPQLSGVALTQGAIAELLRRYGERIVAIKDSAGDRAHSLALAHWFMPAERPGIGVHVGHEPDLPALGRLGSGGAISGLANFMPRTVRRLVLEPDTAQATADLALVERLLAVLRGYALIPSLKAIQAMQTGDAAWRRVRAPLVALDDERYGTLRRELAPLALDAATD
jgi:4-hydroxy-tetrahydrodipicolinate synthase